MRTIQLVIVTTIIALASGCSTVSFDYPREDSIAVNATLPSSLKDRVDGWHENNEGPSGFYPLFGGNDALGARLWLLQRAEHSIDAQYFMMKGDTAGQVFAGAMLQAADRGVRVRFLLDDVFTTVTDEELALIDAHPNIEVRLYNPISRRGIAAFNFLGDFKRANRRMHNKSFVADNQIAIVGGRNIADEYFELRTEGEFLDLDVIGIGPVAQNVSAEFDSFWNHSRSLPMDAISHGFSDAELEQVRLDVEREIRDADASAYQHALSSNLLHELMAATQTLFSASAEVLTDGPNKLDRPIGVENEILVSRLDEVVRGATAEVIVMTPYLVPGDQGVEFWRSVVANGARVVIVTNSLASNNHTAVHSGYAKYRKDLIDAGVELHEARADSVTRDAGGAAEAEHLTLHTKSMLIDRQQVFIGSLNLDPRSIEINSEMGVLIDSAELGAVMAEHFLDDLHNRTYRVERDARGSLQWRGTIDGIEVVETKEPLTSGWLRFKAWFLKIVPDSQL